MSVLLHRAVYNMNTAVLSQCCSARAFVKVLNNVNYTLSTIWQSGIFVFALLYMHVCAYVCDQPPPTLALLLKISSTVTHSHANSGMLTHTYHTTKAQVVSLF